MDFLVKCACALLLAASLVACAASKPDRQPPSSLQGGSMLKPGGLLLAGFDLNQDYTVDRAELAAGLDHAFRNADSDDSGQLTLFEYQDWAAMALGSSTALPGWMELDRNADTSIDSTEFRSGFERLAQKYGQSTPEGLPLAALTQNLEEIRATRSTGSRSSRPGRGGGAPRE